MRRVLVTPTSFGRDDPGLKAVLESQVEHVMYNTRGHPLQASELLPLVRDVDGYIAGLDEINAEVLQAAVRLRVVSRYGVGVDRVDLDEATRLGIVVTNTPGANTASVSELAIALMLSLARRIPQANQAARQGKWPRWPGIGLRDKTIGLIGFGAIGRAVAARLRAFECRLLVSDPNITAAEAHGYAVELTGLDELLREADIVSLHLPALPETRGMVNENFLQRMKPGALLVNTARGELIDEAALQQALENGWLAGAALDCFSQEPPDPSHPLLKLPQVILTPHIGAQTDEAVNQMGWMAVEACLAALNGERPRHVVNTQVYLHGLREAG